MPSVLTGANLANRDLIYLGVSGDGDSASIGLGQFAHAMRRGVNMVYIVENNGVYGLTKGQFSATADKGSKAKRGAINHDQPIDMVMLALQLGASFVARGFSGDKEQLVPLIRAALAHQGAAFIDVLSPCVAFNNHPGSTKSYDYVREHNEAVNRSTSCRRAPRSPPTMRPGTVQDVMQHDGTVLRLRKLHADYDAERQDRGGDPPAAPPGGGRNRHRRALCAPRRRGSAPGCSTRLTCRSTQLAEARVGPRRRGAGKIQRFVALTRRGRGQLRQAPMPRRFFAIAWASQSRRSRDGNACGVHLARRRERVQFHDARLLANAGHTRRGGPPAAGRSRDRGAQRRRQAVYWPHAGAREGCHGARSRRARRHPPYAGAPAQARG